MGPLDSIWDPRALSWLRSGRANVTERRGDGKPGEKREETVLGEKGGPEQDARQHLVRGD